MILKWNEVVEGGSHIHLSFLNDEDPVSITVFAFPCGHLHNFLESFCVIVGLRDVRAEPDSFLI